MEIRVQSDAGHDLTVNLVAPPMGETVEYELDFNGGRCGELAVIVPADLPLAGLEFIYFLERADGLARSGQFDVPAEGELRCETLPTGDWTLELTPINAIEPLTLFPDLEFAIEEDAVSRRTLPALPSGELPITVRSSSSEAIPACVVRLDGDAELAVTVEAECAGVRSIRY